MILKMRFLGGLHALLDFQYFRNDEAHWCSAASVLKADRTRVQSDIFPYSYNNRIFFLNRIEGPVAPPEPPFLGDRPATVPGA